MKPITEADLLKQSADFRQQAHELLANLPEAGAVRNARLRFAMGLLRDADELEANKVHWANLLNGAMPDKSDE